MNDLPPEASRPGHQAIQRGTASAPASFDGLSQRYRQQAGLEAAPPLSRDSSGSGASLPNGVVISAPSPRFIQHHHSFSSQPQRTSPHLLAAHHRTHSFQDSTSSNGSPYSVSPLSGNSVTHGAYGPSGSGIWANLAPGSAHHLRHSSSNGSLNQPFYGEPTSRGHSPNRSLSPNPRGLHSRHGSSDSLLSAYGGSHSLSKLSPSVGLGLHRRGHASADILGEPDYFQLSRSPSTSPLEGPSASPRDRSKETRRESRTRKRFVWAFGLLFGSVAIYLLRWHLNKPPPPPITLREPDQQVRYNDEKGIAYISPDQAKHPILDLMRHAHIEWSNKLGRQSRTLKDAVHEYKRRYRCAPPRGFDKWFRFAQENGVILTDEYDQIWRDIEPFRGIPSQIYKDRMMDVMERPRTFTFVFDGASPVDYSIIGDSVSEGDDLALLIDQISALIPGSMTMTVIADDKSSHQSTWEYLDKLRLLGAGAFKEHRFNQPDRPIDDHELLMSDTAKACPPESAARLDELRDGTVPDAPEPTSWQPASLEGFIYDHSKAMDPCLNPEMRWIHSSATVNGHLHPYLMPFMTWSKSHLQSDILITPTQQHTDEDEDWEIDPEWDDKPLSAAIWRGSSTGSEFVKGNEVRWRLSQRWRLHKLAKATPGDREIMWTVGDGRLRKVTKPYAELNAAYLNASLAGRPLQCDQDTCLDMALDVPFSPFVSLAQSYKHKYLLDVDGNAFSGRFRRFMFTNSAVLKATGYPEWMTERIQPWVHYIPVQLDYSDIYDIMAFFTGVDGKGAHDDLGREIGQAGKEWARDHWRRRDMAAYMLRVLLELCRLQNRDEKDSWDFVLPEDTQSDEL
ncbi:glycosyltransferase family 90 protein [Mixia osmundae IAM 14324]|uniref:Glycosyl transferase CAP10 domain-containing protein n=1 Tax=Mixia osmundae (strain CBS 9802 / IAM 14324 / JCM 22182 / KY 12970) TaxID=764103 RepID=G7DYP6_MIXOS|nr:glycosyltransferase family 90 protein [Mixia osmundae IAM 14324]KEI41606.1 glycosyltransferase family 90 protein [Mixia osmundae IAM 14324]GAA95706.1 hypothetical protein E5Q_02363 [Mixia osmundae IAM 14324]